MTRKEKLLVIRTQCRRVGDMVARAEQHAENGKKSQALFDLDGAVDYARSLMNHIKDLQVMIREDYPEGAGKGRSRPRGIAKKAAHVRSLLGR